VGFPVGEAPAKLAVRLEKTGPSGLGTTSESTTWAANDPSLPWAQSGVHSCARITDEPTASVPFQVVHVICVATMFPSGHPRMIVAGSKTACSQSAITSTCAALPLEMAGEVEGTVGLAVDGADTVGGTSVGGGVGGTVVVDEVGMTVVGPGTSAGVVPTGVVVPIGVVVPADRGGF
jgi:hypothetical protein